MDQLMYLHEYVWGLTRRPPPLLHYPAALKRSTDKQLGPLPLFVGTTVSFPQRQKTLRDKHLKALHVKTVGELCLGKKKSK